MNILDQIILNKKQEVYNKKSCYSINILEKGIFFKKKVISLYDKIQHSYTGIISEFKRGSPSLGIINKQANLEKVVQDYEKYGSIAISILTDYKFFYGTNHDFIQSRKLVNVPLLRKDFIIDEYQIIESKYIGADIILLIANILSKTQIKNFLSLTKDIGLEAIIEIFDDIDIEKIIDLDYDIVGINKRNLKTFEINSDDQMIQLANKLPKTCSLIAESGINNTNDILKLINKGFKGFLIGTSFMKSNNPGLSCKKLINKLQIELQKKYKKC
ncbi:indole-3-glycerol phosphate synthase TrpC [Blattabacterium cuenoti]|uniref:indole-3-glycerol phosphate synthase TrpC n=1 Tax=Blattabacterium cuenoti TaxID=1653831 RepID=UPI00163C11B4|nr:indole-3-glycerol phosphate synthase TrpC [Blattabacterium cuenoti]